MKRTDFEPGAVSLLDRHYDDNGYEISRVIRNIPAVICQQRVPRDLTPAGFNHYQVRGTDWSELDDTEELLRLCEDHREALRNHLTDEEYDRLAVAVEEDEECADEFYELRDALNDALADDGAPLVEGFEETLREGVLVDFWCTVFMKESLADIRRELGLQEGSPVDVSTGYCGTGDCDVWEEFLGGLNL